VEQEAHPNEEEQETTPHLIALHPMGVLAQVHGVEARWLVQATATLLDQVVVALVALPLEALVALTATMAGLQAATALALDTQAVVAVEEQAETEETVLAILEATVEQGRKSLLGRAQPVRAFLIIMLAVVVVDTRALEEAADPVVEVTARTHQTTAVMVRATLELQTQEAVAAVGQAGEIIRGRPIAAAQVDRV